MMKSPTNILRQTFYTDHDLGFHHESFPERKAVYAVWMMFQRAPATTTIGFNNELKRISDIYDVSPTRIKEVFKELETYDIESYAFNPEDCPRRPVPFKFGDEPRDPKITSTIPSDIKKHSVSIAEMMERVRKNNERSITKALADLSFELLKVKTTSVIDDLVKKVELKYHLYPGELRSKWIEIHKITIESYVLEGMDTNKIAIYTQDGNDINNITDCLSEIMMVLPSCHMVSDVTKAIYASAKKRDILVGIIRKVWQDEFNCTIEMYWRENVKKLDSSSHSRSYHYTPYESNDEKAWRILSEAVEKAKNGESFELCLDSYRK